MKNKLVIFSSIFLGLILGIIFTGITINISAGRMMIKEMKSPYDYEKTISVITERINLKAGWHVVGVIDQNKEVQASGGKSIGKYSIIQYCNGKYSSQMLIEDEQKRIGTMMPKTLSVYEKSDGQVYVSTANGAVMGKLFDSKTEAIIERVSLEVEDIMRFMNFKFTLIP